jgi:hypothetical protein
MNANLKLAAGLAAVAVIAVVGWRLLPGTGGPGGPSPSPSPSPTPSLSSTPTVLPSGSAMFPGWYPSEGSSGAGILPAGSQASHSFNPAITFNVTEGWVNDTDTVEFYGLFPDTPANESEFAVSGGLAQHIFMWIVDTPGGLICDGVGDTAGSTAAQLADSLVANETVATSGLAEVTIGGLTGKQVDARLNPDWAAGCPPNPDDPPTKDYGDYRARYIFLDVPSGGKLMIIVDSVHAAGFEAFVAEAMPIVQSFQFDLAQ